MDRRCETCGQTLPVVVPADDAPQTNDASSGIHGAVPSSAIDGEVLDVQLLPVGEATPTAKEDRAAVIADLTEPAAQQSSPFQRPLLGLAGLAVLGLIAFFTFGTGDGGGPSAGGTGDDGSRNIVDDESQPPATLGPFDRNDPFDEPEVVDAQSAALGELIGENRLAYLAADGVVIVDLEAGVAPTAEFEPESFDQFGDLAELSGFQLLNEGDTTYGIDVGSELTVHQFSNSGRLIPTEEDGLFSITSDPDDDWERLFVATSAGFFMADLEVPAGSAYLNVAGLGSLVSPPVGGTFLASIEGFERFSEHRVVAATPRYHVEIQCDDALVCHPYLRDRSTDDWQQIPDEFAGDQGSVSVSPDGRWILRTDSDDDVAFDSETGGFHRLDTRPKGRVVWSPDSRFAVWFDPLTNEPRLQVLYPERRSSETIDLSELGAADRAGSEVVVFS